MAFPRITPPPMARQKQGWQREEMQREQPEPDLFPMRIAAWAAEARDGHGCAWGRGPIAALEETSGFRDTVRKLASSSPGRHRLDRRLRQLLWSHTMNVIPVVEALPVCPACDSSHPNRRRTPRSGSTAGRVSGSGAPERLHSLPQGHAFYRPDLQGPLPLERV